MSKHILFRFPAESKISCEDVCSSRLFYGVGISQRRWWTCFPHQIELTNIAHGLCISAVECVFFPLWEVEDVCVVNP